MTTLTATDQPVSTLAPAQERAEHLRGVLLTAVAAVDAAKVLLDGGGYVLPGERAYVVMDAIQSSADLHTWLRLGQLRAALSLAKNALWSAQYDAEQHVAALAERHVEALAESRDGSEETF